MSANKINVVFYHSVVCPRCHFSGLMLGRLLRKHPDIEVTKVEFLTNTDRARADGVRSIPALVAQGRSLTGVVLTPSKIERFLESLTA
jgi:predicted DsbA family dithiol-disulfide isomerase